jgi:hypothetical protein
MERGACSGLVGRLMERDHFEDLGFDGSTVLK